MHSHQLLHDAVLSPLHPRADPGRSSGVLAIQGCVLKLDICQPLPGPGWAVSEGLLFGGGGLGPRWDTPEGWVLGATVGLGGQEQTGREVGMGLALGLLPQTGPRLCSLDGALPGDQPRDREVDLRETVVPFASRTGGAGPGQSRAAPGGGSP